MNRYRSSNTTLNNVTAIWLLFSAALVAFFSSWLARLPNIPFVAGDFTLAAVLKRVSAGRQAEYTSLLFEVWDLKDAGARFKNL